MVIFHSYVNVYQRVAALNQAADVGCVWFGTTAFVPDFCRTVKYFSNVIVPGIDLVPSSSSRQRQVDGTEVRKGLNSGRK